MTLVPAPAHGGTKEPGGTMLAIRLILMAHILMVHILLMPMASNGTRSEVTTILWRAQRWKLKLNSKSLEPGSSNIPAQEQLLFRSTMAHKTFWQQRLVCLIVLQEYLVFITLANCFIYVNNKETGAPKADWGIKTLKEQCKWCDVGNSDFFSPCFIKDEFKPAEPMLEVTLL